MKNKIGFKLYISIKVIFVFILLFYSIGCQSRDKATDEKNSNVKYIAYYFHPTARCEECLNLESFLKALIETKCANKGFEFKPLNIEEKENEHFKKDFQLTFSSVVITKYETGMHKDWIKLDSIWQFTHDKKNFFRYAEKEINNFINKN